MELDEKIIVSGYAIAIDNNKGLDGAYDGNGDCLTYFNSNTGAWRVIDHAEITNKEHVLVKILESATASVPGHGAKPFPVKVTTTVSTLHSDKFDSYLTQLKRERALKKLSEEDMIALGLMGAKE